MDQDRTDASLSNVVRIDDERIRDHLGQIVEIPTKPARCSNLKPVAVPS